MKLTIQTNRINHESAHNALAMGGFAQSWQPGERDGELCVDLTLDDVCYLPLTLIELSEAEVPFRLESEGYFTDERDLPSVMPFGPTFQIKGYAK